MMKVKTEQAFVCKVGGEVLGRDKREPWRVMEMFYILIGYGIQMYEMVKTH